jgi:hypothetical protein
LVSRSKDPTSPIPIGTEGLSWPSQYTFKFGSEIRSIKDQLFYVGANVDAACLNLQMLGSQYGLVLVW